MESLSGFTDLVVSIKKVKGGFKTWSADVEAETGQSLHLQATHLEQNEINFYRYYRYYRSTYELGDIFFILKKLKKKKNYQKGTIIRLYLS